MKLSCFIELRPFEISDLNIKIKSKWDCVELLLKCARFVVFNFCPRAIKLKEDGGINISEAYLKLAVKPVPRLYLYVGENKYISIVFPFELNAKSENFEIYYAGICLNEYIISGIFTLINLHKKYYSDQGNTQVSLLDLYLSNDEIEPIPDDSYYVLGELLAYELGYIRHDYDPNNAKGKIHPEYHFDVNFSQKATFKYGLDRMLSNSEFESIFDKEKDCFYIRP